MRDGLHEQWLSGNPVTKDLMDKKNVEMQDGGNQIVVDLEYQDNDTVAWVDQDTPLSTTINQILKQATYQWSVIGGTVGLGYHDEAKNSGAAARHKLWTTRMKNLKKYLHQQHGTGLNQRRDSEYETNMEPA